MDIKMRCDASRGRKSKAGGGKKIKSDSRIYTPEKFPLDTLHHSSLKEISEEK